MRRLVLFFVAAALCLPLAAIVTLLAAPLWRWIEATWAVESFGHSGPASWCYVAVYLLLMSLVSAAFLPRRRRAR